MKAWELARLILPSISSRAPDKTHLPAPEQDHGNLFVFVGATFTDQHDFFGHFNPETWLSGGVHASL